MNLWELYLNSFIPIILVRLVYNEYMGAIFKLLDSHNVSKVSLQ